MKSLYLRLNLFQRLLLSISIITITSLVLVVVTTYIKASSTIEQQATLNFEQIVNNVSFQMDDYLHNYELATLPLVTNDEVRAFVEQIQNTSFERYLNHYEIQSQMSALITQRPEIEQIYLMEETGRYIRAIEKRGVFPNREFYQDLHERTPESGRIITYPRVENNQFVITLARKIRGTSTYDTKGILAVDLNASKLIRLWKNIEVYENSFFMIVDEDDKIIFHPNYENIGKEIKKSIKSELALTTNGNFYETWNHQNTFFYFKTSEFTGWKLVLAVPRTTLFEPISVIRTTVAIFGVIALCLSLILAQHFIRKIVNPIRVLESTMKYVEKGNWKLAPEPEGHDEISTLVRNYNRMVNRLSTLVDQVYKVELENQKGKILLQERELEKQKVELQALQAQINPHFLYNTLGTINSYAIMKEEDEISEMTEALANMFRYSLQNIEVVKIEKELSHIKSFLIIQQHRWDKQISLTIDIEPQLMQTEVVKLSLQPLVENAIEHGFDRISEDFEITIKAEVSGDVLYISVIDNGMGIGPTKLEELSKRLENEELHPKVDQGIGLLNVSKRTKLLFGHRFGIEIFSELNKGTNIRLAVPYKRKKANI